MAELNKALLPYGTTSSSPAIVLPDTELFLSERGSLTKNYFENAVELLNREYDSIRRLAELNELVFSSSYNFRSKSWAAVSFIQESRGEVLAQYD